MLAVHRAALNTFTSIGGRIRPPKLARTRMRFVPNAGSEFFAADVARIHRRTVNVAASVDSPFLFVWCRGRLLRFFRNDGIHRRRIFGRGSVNLCEIYKTLIAQYGQAGIDSILCPCWDKDLTLCDPDGVLSYPYRDFIDNLEWFLGLLREKGMWPQYGNWRARTGEPLDTP